MDTLARAYPVSDPRQRQRNDMAVVGTVFARALLGRARANASDSGQIVHDCHVKRRHIAHKRYPRLHVPSFAIDAQACFYERQLYANIWHFAEDQTWG